jgi:hypothetical protein
MSDVFFSSLLEIRFSAAVLELARESRPGPGQSGQKVRADQA